MQTFSLDALIDVQTLPPTGALLGRLEADETARAGLAERFGFVSVDRLVADLRIKRAAKGAWDVRGTGRDCSGLRCDRGAGLGISGF